MYVGLRRALQEHPRITSHKSQLELTKQKHRRETLLLLIHTMKFPVHALAFALSTTALLASTSFGQQQAQALETSKIEKLRHKIFENRRRRADDHHRNLEDSSPDPAAFLDALVAGIPSLIVVAVDGLVDVLTTLVTDPANLFNAIFEAAFNLVAAAVVIVVNVGAALLPPVINGKKKKRTRLLFIYYLIFLYVTHIALLCCILFLFYYY